MKPSAITGNFRFAVVVIGMCGSWDEDDELVVEMCVLMGLKERSNSSIAMLSSQLVGVEAL